MQVSSFSGEPKVVRVARARERSKACGEAMPWAKGMA